MRGALCLVHLQDPKGGVRIRCVQCICCLRCKKGVARTLFSTVSEVFYKSMEKARAAGNMLRVVIGGIGIQLLFSFISRQADLRQIAS